MHVIAQSFYFIHAMDLNKKYDMIGIEVKGSEKVIQHECIGRGDKNVIAKETPPLWRVLIDNLHTTHS